MKTTLLAFSNTYYMELHNAISSYYGVQFYYQKMISFHYKT